VVPNALPVAERRFSKPARERVRTEHGIPDGAFVVGCVSRFHHKKRNDVAVDAVVELGSDDVHLIMAGEGETEAELRRRSRPLGQRSHFLPTPGREITNVCSAFDVSVCCPSPTEGAPLAVIYSMLASRPVVATAAEGVRELILPGVGTIVSPENDPAALADVLRGYVHDQSRCQREGLAGRAQAELTFSASSVGAQIEQLLFAKLDEHRAKKDQVRRDLDRKS
jgi:glycosyltransferase involved in cell wall biosynthesis